MQRNVPKQSEKGFQRKLWHFFMGRFCVVEFIDKQTRPSRFIYSVYGMVFLCLQTGNGIERISIKLKN